jgi:hypothetical protein
MKIVSLAMLIAVAGLLFALSGAPSTSEADSHTSTCETCGKSKRGECPHCAAGERCPHCDKGEACPQCGGHHGYHHGHHGKWGGHQWEYKCVRPTKKTEETNRQFNSLGAEGWRLVQADGGLWCFGKVKVKQ